MARWENDEFLAAWDKKYVSTNVTAGARPYDPRFFKARHAELGEARPELQNYADAIIATVCCAVGRADMVGRFFDHLTANSPPEESRQIFLRLREAITIVFPYLGMPACIPACYGMIGVVQRKGAEFGSTRVLRTPTIGQEEMEKGRALRTRIYRTAGNSEIFGLMDEYFTDLFTCSTLVTWGYLVAKANEEVYQPQESHLIIAATIMALGATRQTKSHIKATLGMGNAVGCVKTVVQVVTQIAAWADRPIATVDVDDLSRQVQEALKAS